MDEDIEELGNIFEETQFDPSLIQYSTTKQIAIDDEPKEIDQPVKFTKEICKIYIRTFGCSHNQSDSEYMAGLLAKEKRFEIVQSFNEADLVLVNSCTVKNPSQEAFLTVVRQARIAKKFIIVAGCVPQSQKYIAEIDCYSVIGVTQIDQVVHVVDETLKGNIVKLLKRKSLPSLKFSIFIFCLTPFIRFNKVRNNQLVEISDKFLGACSYCKTVQDRGKLYKLVAQEGIKDIYITSENNKDIFPFKLKEKLNQGGFGSVYLGVNLLDDQEVIVKFIKNFTIFENEVAILKILNSDQSKSKRYWPDLYYSISSKQFKKLWGIPKEFKKGNIIIMERLGPSLDDLQFSKELALAISIQILQALECLYSKKIIHGDIKPDNICIGSSSTVTQIYFIDFGMSICLESNETESNRRNASFIGTYPFSSINQQKCGQFCFKDDVESAFYSLLYFLNYNFVDLHFDNCLYWKEDLLQMDLECSQSYLLKIQDYLKKLHQYIPVDYSYIQSELACELYSCWNSTQIMEIQNDISINFDTLFRQLALPEIQMIHQQIKEQKQQNNNEENSKEIEEQKQSKENQQKKKEEEKISNQEYIDSTLFCRNSAIYKEKIIDQMIEQEIRINTQIYILCEHLSKEMDIKNDLLYTLGTFYKKLEQLQNFLDSKFALNYQLNSINDFCFEIKEDKRKITISDQYKLLNFAMGHLMFKIEESDNSKLCYWIEIPLNFQESYQFYQTTVDNLKYDYRVNEFMLQCHDELMNKLTSKQRDLYYDNIMNDLLQHSEACLFINLYKYLPLIAQQIKTQLSQQTNQIIFTEFEFVLYSTRTPCKSCQFILNNSQLQKIIFTELAEQFNPKATIEIKSINYYISWREDYSFKKKIESQFLEKKQRNFYECIDQNFEDLFEKNPKKELERNIQSMDKQFYRFEITSFKNLMKKKLSYTIFLNKRFNYCEMKFVYLQLLQYVIDEEPILLPKKQETMVLAKKQGKQPKEKAKTQENLSFQELFEESLFGIATYSNSSITFYNQEQIFIFTSISPFTGIFKGLKLMHYYPFLKNMDAQLQSWIRQDFLNKSEMPINNIELKIKQILMLSDTKIVCVLEGFNKRFYQVKISFESPDKMSEVKMSDFKSLHQGMNQIYIGQNKTIYEINYDTGEFYLSELRDICYSPCSFVQIVPPYFGLQLIENQVNFYYHHISKTLEIKLEYNQLVSLHLKESNKTKNVLKVSCYILNLTNNEIEYQKLKIQLGPVVEIKKEEKKIYKDIKCNTNDFLCFEKQFQSLYKNQFMVYKNASNQILDCKQLPFIILQKKEKLPKLKRNLRALRKKRWRTRSNLTLLIER